MFLEFLKEKKALSSLWHFLKQNVLVYIINKCYISITTLIFF